MIETNPISINLHLTRSCNMDCHGCFAKYEGPTELGETEWLGCIELIARETISRPKRKLNFVGGEPTLLDYLPRLVARAKSLGFITGIVSNGSLITREWIGAYQGMLDMVGISVDSLQPERNKMLGRVIDGQPVNRKRYLDIIEVIKGTGFPLKINTVVSAHNFQEDFNEFIKIAMPARWKVMQYLRISGQNGQIDGYEIGRPSFESFVLRHSANSCMVAEDESAMVGSYIMVDPAGRPYGNIGRQVRYGVPMLKAGLLGQLQGLGYDAEATRRRGGLDF